METINPLRNMVSQTERGIWIPLGDFAAMVVVEFRKVGYNLNSPKNIAAAFSLLKVSDFIEHNEDDFTSVRISGYWYDAI